MDLPLILDEDEAIEAYESEPDKTDAFKAYIVGVLSNFGISNRRIGELLGIEKKYTVTHLKRCGTLLTESELQFWQDNSSRISLGHVRAIAKYPPEKRDDMMRSLVSKGRKQVPTVREFEAIAAGKNYQSDADIKAYVEQMSTKLGREISIKNKAPKNNGKLIISYYGLTDLDNIARSLGFVFDADLD